MLTLSKTTIQTFVIFLSLQFMFNWEKNTWVKIPYKVLLPINICCLQHYVHTSSFTIKYSKRCHYTYETRLILECVVSLWVSVCVLVIIILRCQPNYLDLDQFKKGLGQTANPIQVAVTASGSSEHFQQLLTNSKYQNKAMTKSWRYCCSLTSV